MSKYDKYDISKASYTREMDEKATQYNTLVIRARKRNAEMKGKPTKEEAELYSQAIKVCDEIMSMNLSQRAVYSKWNYNKIDCEKNFNRIADILSPPPPPKEEEQPVPQKTTQNNGSAAKRAEAPKAPQASKTGFTTQYATKEVPVEVIESWFKDDELPDLQSVVGRTALKERLMKEADSVEWDKINEALDINPVQCYFLYGPPGTGKTHLIKAFAGELKKKGFRFMKLVGSEVHSAYVGMAEKIVTAAFNVAVENEPCLIFMDEIDLLCPARGNKSEGHENRLTGAFLEAYNHLKDSRKRVVFMGATNFPGNVDEAMLDRLTPIEIPLPEQEDRVGYFKRMLDKIPGAAEEGFSAEDMAAATENCNYRDLDKLKQYMGKKIKAQAIQENLVLDEAGQLDSKATDEKASQAVLNGEVKITRELFEQAQKDNPPLDKTRSLQAVEEFKARIASAG